MLAVEVIARFADTVVDQRHVLAGRAYRIGACAGSELAVELVRAVAFPIVDSSAAGFVVRRPVDHAATIRRGAVAVAMTGTEHRLAPGERFELVTGDVTITAALTELPPTRLALSRPEARAPAYIAASTVVHIAVWAVAVLYAPLERLEPETTAYRVARLPRAHAPDPTPAPSSGDTNRDAEAQPAAKQAPPGPPDPDATRAARKPSRKQARGEGASGHVSLADGIRAITGTRDLRKDFEQLGPLYDADEAQSGNFGNSRRFDPTADEDFGTVKTGAYATVATGQPAGQHYELAPRESPDLELCESPRAPPSAASIARRSADTSRPTSRQSPRATTATRAPPSRCSSRSPRMAAWYASRIARRSARASRASSRRSRSRRRTSRRE